MRRHYRQVPREDARGPRPTGDRATRRATELRPGARRPGRRRRRDELRRQRRHLPRQDRAARPAAAAGRVGRRLLDGVRLLPRSTTGSPRRPAATAPVGDQRIVPDLVRLVVLAAQPGWAWAPGDRYDAGRASRTPSDSRLLLRRLVDELGRAGHHVQVGVRDRVGGLRRRRRRLRPGGRRARLRAWPGSSGVSDYCRDVLDALAAQGRRRGAVPPRVRRRAVRAVGRRRRRRSRAADTSVLVRATIRAVGAAHGFRTSFSPKVDAAGVGNGGHVHLSLWRDGENLMAGGDRRFGLTARRRGVQRGGVLAHLPALLALGAPSVASYLRLVPRTGPAPTRAGGWRTGRPRCGW